MVVVLNAEESDLAELLQLAKPSWPKPSLDQALEKLADVGVDSAQQLVDKIEDGTLNAALSTAGHKRFHKPTLQAIRKCWPALRNIAGRHWTRPLPAPRLDALRCGVVKAPNKPVEKPPPQLDVTKIAQTRAKAQATHDALVASGAAPELVAQLQEELAQIDFLLHKLKPAKHWASVKAAAHFVTGPHVVHAPEWEAYAKEATKERPAPKQASLVRAAELALDEHTRWDTYAAARRRLDSQAHLHERREVAKAIRDEYTSEKAARKAEQQDVWASGASKGIRASLSGIAQSRKELAQCKDQLAQVLSREAKREGYDPRASCSTQRLYGGLQNDLRSADVLADEDRPNTPARGMSRASSRASLRARAAVCCVAASRSSSRASLRH